MVRPPPSLRSVRGNILFLILLAVVLFAALSYAVTQSMRGGGKDASDENLKANVADMQQFFSAVDSAVLRMHMNGLAYEDISFVYDAKTKDGTALNGYADNPRCTSDVCRVFKPAGGGVPYRDFKKYSANDTAVGWGDSWIGGGHFVLSIWQWPGAGTDKSDIIMTYPLIPPAMCAALTNVPMLGNPPLTGAANGADPLDPSTWDLDATTVISPPPEMYTETIAYSPFWNGDRCDLFHLVIKR